ncbi:MAG TPA: PrsW family glutamic-type intramembrane protease, partial [Allocoleopsis sp.]
MDESLSGAAIASVMVQADWFKLAQQGDAGAIGQLLNHQLQPRGVAAKVLHKDDCLKILLIADRPLDQQAFVRFLQQQINRLNIPGLQRVRVYSQKPGESNIQWSQEFVPAAAMTSAAPHVSISAMRALNLPALPPQQALSSEYLKSISATPTRGKTDQAYSTPYAQNGAIVRSASPVTSFWQTLRSFHLKTILPYDDVLNSDLYRTHAVRLLLFLGLFPLVVNLFAEQAGLAQTAWLLGIYYAAIWGVVLYQIIRPTQFSWGNTLKCTLFTTFIGIPTLLLFQRVPPFNTLYDAVHGDLLARLIGFVLGVGVLEEICKALPVYLLLIRPQRLNDPQT